MLNDTKICKQKLSWSLAPSAPVSFYYKWCNQEILQLQPLKKTKSILIIIFYSPTMDR